MSAGTHASGEPASADALRLVAAGRLFGELGERAAALAAVLNTSLMLDDAERARLAAAAHHLSMTLGAVADVGARLCGETVHVGDFEDWHLWQSLRSAVDEARQAAPAGARWGGKA